MLIGSQIVFSSVYTKQHKYTYGHVALQVSNIGIFN